MKIVIYIVLVILILILIIYSLFTLNKMKEFEVKVADYMGCIHCNIYDQEFSKLHDPRIFYYFNLDKLSRKEYAGIVKFSSQSYDKYIRAEIKASNLTPDLAVNKKTYIDFQIDSYLNGKKYKLDKWKKLVDPDTQKKPGPLNKLLISFFQKWYL